MQSQLCSSVIKSLKTNGIEQMHNNLDIAYLTIIVSDNKIESVIDHYAVWVLDSLRLLIAVTFTKSRIKYIVGDLWAQLS